ncbi:MAG: CopG family transcriptional regulator [Desulfuromonadaceae bacterium]|nr:CopG family transcriptional regulator [Desulfuromonadaceae bacterium]
MLAIKINDPAIEKELAAMAKIQHISRQEVVRTMIAKQLEDRADYRLAMKSLQDPAPAIPLEEVMRRYGMEY